MMDRAKKGTKTVVLEILYMCTQRKESCCNYRRSLRSASQSFTSFDVLWLYIVLKVNSLVSSVLLKSFLVKNSMEE